MSTPASKRRRLDNAASALSKPFRSPFKVNPAVDNADQDIQQQQDPSSPNVPSSSSLPAHRLQTPVSSPVSSVRRNIRRDVDLSSKPMKVPNTDVDLAPILKSQRQLESRLRELKEELHVTQQARKIEFDSQKHESYSGEIDGELVALTKKWKAASQQAADELFGGVKDRVNRMGGPRAWREMQKSQMEFRRGFDDEPEPPQADSQEGNNSDRELADKYAGCDIELETENEFRERNGDNNPEDDEEEDEFTMPMMLKSLNIDPSIIGYDKENERWID